MFPTKPAAPPAVGSSVTMEPIGVVRTPFTERVAAPRQPSAATSVPGTIELYPDRHFEDALSDLEGWDYIWVVFWFHLNEGWRPKVLPPRSEKKRGLFATRSPHRPNPIGLSVVKLARIEGLCLHVHNVDMVDGTPVLDIKPYVPYADAITDARTGWLTPDPDPGFAVVWSEGAALQAAWLRDEHGVDLRSPVDAALGLGAKPHAYRRIKRDGDAGTLAVKDWRIRFGVNDRVVTVLSIASGYRERQPVSGRDDALEVHRAFVRTFA